MTSRPTILVTGCSTGIGHHCAHRLRADGWQVFATARKPEDIERLTAAGFSVHYLDYREPESIAALFDAVMADTDGRLDALFNNGAYAQPGAVEDVPIEALREQFEANFFGWHDLTRRFVPVMRAQGHGRIVHCSSVVGYVPVPWRGAYCASKYALEGLMTTLRMELDGSGIFVSLIEPGPIPSQIATNSLAYVEKYIDVEGSVHQAAYDKRLGQLRAGGTPDDGQGCEPVYRALRKSLTANRPRPHYLVTRQAYIGALLARVLPADAYYRLITAMA